jgi:hypothetical protein
MAEEQGKRGLFARATEAVKADLQRGQAESDEARQAREAQQAASAAQVQEAAAASADARARWIATGEVYEYRVESIRETLMGDKIKTADLEALLNRYAQDFWHVKSITSASVAGRMGPGGTSGLVIVFERRVWR